MIELKSPSSERQTGGAERDRRVEHVWKPQSTPLQPHTSKCWWLQAMRLLYFNMVVEADATMLKHSWGHASSGQGVGGVCAFALLHSTEQLTKVSKPVGPIQCQGLAAIPLKWMQFKWLHNCLSYRIKLPNLVYRVMQNNGWKQTKSVFALDDRWAFVLKPSNTEKLLCACVVWCRCRLGDLSILGPFQRE